MVMTRKAMQRARCEAINDETVKIRNCYTSLAKKIIEEVLMPAFQWEQEADKTRGMLLGAISQKFDTIAQFTAFEGFVSFEKKGKNKVKRVENHKIKVTIEVDMVCGVV